MELMIRDAVLADCPAITRLNREEMGYDYPLDKTFAKLQACLANPAYKILAAEREGRVGGYLHLETYDLLYADSMVNVCHPFLSYLHSEKIIIIFSLEIIV